MKNLGQMMKQAQEMQSRMAEMQAQLGDLEVEGSAGGGKVRATLSGKGDLRAVKIDPSLVVASDVEMLEDLIVVAVSDAKAKVDAEVQNRMGKLTGGLNLPPGFKLPF
jgi:DNA-binding YbaB/EbfC family protein